MISTSQLYNGSRLSSIYTLQCLSASCPMSFARSQSVSLSYDSSKAASRCFSRGSFVSKTRKHVQEISQKYLTPNLPEDGNADSDISDSAPYQRTFLYFVPSLSFIANAAFVATLYTQCSPMSRVWNPDIQGTCWKAHVERDLMYWQGGQP